jgi:hypothetical protein
MTKFNGHKNWNHWNVSLWINNDEGLYRMAQRLNSIMSKQDAAEEMLHILKSNGQAKTPDGAPYSITTIKAAMREM